MQVTLPPTVSLVLQRRWLISSSLSFSAAGLQRKEIVADTARKISSSSSAAMTGSRMANAGPQGSQIVLEDEEEGAAVMNPVLLNHANSQIKIKSGTKFVVPFFSHNKHLLAVVHFSSAYWHLASL